ncbi:hypothetical protein BFW38_14125 [Terasakiispira papahanaumokuakeensis]|uniref:DUF1302 domain-containing protein n=1 Tax=Terasakiispira papahanaumokuakeensis TaxID=197479 RepID=A0A1E2VBY5_9GAMM|nr:DUF1302 domain-containing protein [Terasakiispira papahanaumokuakeensis]ODC04499.1 hypothetical protein BFW38_14125 [Terasakiispira papahanaumokuakeensis]
MEQNTRLKHLPPLSALALAIATMPYAQAAEFSAGGFDVRIDSSASIGASWRVEERNDDYVAAGTLNASGHSVKGGPAALGGDQTYPGQQTNNTDDGNQNFDKGDLTSLIFKGSHDFNITHRSYPNMGAKVGFRYWYDGALDGLDGPTDGGQANHWRDTDSFDDAKSGIEVMDAYLWSDIDIGGRLGQVKVGRHVLNWGESTFIQGGLNVINPVDVSALRKPGAELKEGLLPVGLVSGSLSLDEAGNWNLGAFYQFERAEVRPDACGTYFSNNDFVSDGCGPVYFTGSTYPENLNGFTFSGTPYEYLATADRAGTKHASSTGSFGVNLKWYAEALNGTEFGLYYLNYHSRLPYIGGYIGENSTNGAAAAGLLANNPTGFSREEQSRYRVNYPENIDLFGFTFSTLLPTGTAWSGEFSYRPNMPIQVNANDILVRGAPTALFTQQAAAAVGAQLVQAGLTPGSAAYNQQLAAGVANATANMGSRPLPSDVAALESGRWDKGYREFPVSQLQMTFIHDFNQTLGADNLRLIGEVGMTYVDDLPDISEMRFGRSSIYGSYGGSNDGYVTDFSWGYRLVGQLEYNNALIGGLTLKPTLSWSHDVEGYGPEPGSQFYEGRQIIGFAMNAEYLNTYTASLSYTDYLDTDYWDLDDRDFISLSLGMNY